MVYVEELALEGKDHVAKIRDDDCHNGKSDVRNDQLAEDVRSVVSQPSKGMKCVKAPYRIAWHEHE